MIFINSFYEIVCILFRSVIVVLLRKHLIQTKESRLCKLFAMFLVYPCAQSHPADLHVFDKNC